MKFCCKKNPPTIPSLSRPPVKVEKSTLRYFWKKKIPSLNIKNKNNNINNNNNFLSFCEFVLGKRSKNGRKTYFLVS